MCKKKAELVERVTEITLFFFSFFFYSLKFFQLSNIFKPFFLSFIFSKYSANAMIGWKTCKLGGFVILLDKKTTTDYVLFLIIKLMFFFNVFSLSFSPSSFENVSLLNWYPLEVHETISPNTDLRDDQETVSRLREKKKGLAPYFWTTRTK